MRGEDTEAPGVNMGRGAITETPTSGSLRTSPTALPLSSFGQTQRLRHSVKAFQLLYTSPQKTTGHIHFSETLHGE